MFLNKLLQLNTAAKLLPAFTCIVLLISSSIALSENVQSDINAETRIQKWRDKKTHIQ